jgi:competence protein ComEC
MFGDRYIAILDVGHGNSAVVRVPEGVVVIDAGPGSSLVEYLTESMINVVDTFLISHADEDHISGLLSILASGKVKIRRVRLNTDSLKGSQIWDDLAYELDSAHRTGSLEFIPSLTRNQNGEFDIGALRVEILGPSGYLASRGPGSKDRRGRMIHTNSISAVIRISYNGKLVALFTGDMDDVGLHDIASADLDAKAPIVVFPHHGGRPGHISMDVFTKDLCKLVQPRAVIFSIGRGRHATPQPKSVAAVRAEVADVWVACTQLSEHCAAELPKVHPGHLNGVVARGRETRRCCAGTILVNLENAAIIRPLKDAHRTFVLDAAPTALCRK